MTRQEQWLEDIANNIILRGDAEVDRLRGLEGPPHEKMVRLLGENWLDLALARVEQMRRDRA